MTRTAETEKAAKMRKRFGVRVKELRQASNWTQKEVAAKLGVQLSIYTKYEHGRHLPPIDKLTELSEILGSTIDYLITGNNSDIELSHHNRLAERFHALEDFSNDDQETVIKIIDSLVIKRKVEGMANNPYQPQKEVV